MVVVGLCDQGGSIGERYVMPLTTLTSLTPLSPVLKNKCDIVV